MSKHPTNGGSPAFIRAGALRERWGRMSNTAFYEKLKKGLIPKPLYPFGGATPYWSMAVIEQFEEDAQQKVLELGQRQGAKGAAPRSALSTGAPAKDADHAVRRPV